MTSFTLAIKSQKTLFFSTLTLDPWP